MKRLIAIAALAAAVAFGADYPLNRVSSVRDSRPVGITEDEANALVREYDRTNLTERIGAKQNALTAGDHVRIEDDVISLDLESGPAPDYGTVSNRAMNARQLRDNVSHVSEHVGFGPWNMTPIDQVHPDEAPHSCVLRQDGLGKWYWAVIGRSSSAYGRSPSFSERREADQLEGFSMEGGYAGLWVSRPAGDVLSVEGEAFVTQTFVTNSVRVASTEAHDSAVAEATAYVDDAVRYSVMSNSSGYITLHADPRRVEFGGPGNNLSNLVVGIVKDLVRNGQLYVTTNGSTMVNGNWRVTLQ